MQYAEAPISLQRLHSGCGSRVLSRRTVLAGSGRLAGSGSEVAPVLEGKVDERQRDDKKQNGAVLQRSQRQPLTSRGFLRPRSICWIRRFATTPQPSSCRPSLEQPREQLSSDGSIGLVARACGQPHCTHTPGGFWRGVYRLLSVTAAVTRSRVERIS
jgi:hypothetical protein